MGLPSWVLYTPLIEGVSPWNFVTLLLTNPILKPILVTDLPYAVIPIDVEFHASVVDFTRIRLGTMLVPCSSGAGRDMSIPFVSLL